MKILPEVMERALRNSTDGCTLCRRNFKEHTLRIVILRLLKSYPDYDVRNVVAVCSDCEWWIQRYHELIAFGLERKT